MAVSLIDRGIRGQAVEVAFPFYVVNPNSFGSLNNDIQRVIVVRAVRVFQGDKFFHTGQFASVGGIVAP